MVLDVCLKDVVYLWFNLCFIRVNWLVSPSVFVICFVVVCFLGLLKFIMGYLVLILG